ncbi:DUF3347 domain-containing protein [Pedobacter sp. UYP24]
MKKYFAAACLLILFSCNNSEQKSTVSLTDSSAVAKTKTDTSTAVKLADPKVQAIYNDYILLKNALVDAKFDVAKQSATALNSSLSKYEGCENTALVASKISVEKDLAGQRKEFTYLSADVIAMFKNAIVTSGSIYVQHCPMANKGEGGDWLSSQKKIQNPYYGSEMLECGAVLQEIK